MLLHSQSFTNMRDAVGFPVQPIINRSFLTPEHTNEGGLLTACQ
jgi:hypothetical protein